MATRDAGRLDPVTDDANWADWSIDRLEAASLNGPLLINDAVYAELAVRYDRTPVSRPLLRAACAYAPRLGSTPSRRKELQLHRE